VEENPFLRRFYEDPERHAFQTQLFFLLERYRRQRELGQLELFSQGIVADYLFAKDGIFAAVTLGRTSSSSTSRSSRCSISGSRGRTSSSISRPDRRCCCAGSASATGTSSAASPRSTWRG